MDDQILDVALFRTSDMRFNRRIDDERVNGIVLRLGLRHHGRPRFVAYDAVCLQSVLGLPFFDEFLGCRTEVAVRATA